MGIYFQPDMNQAKELSRSRVTNVLFPGAQDDDAFAELSSSDLSLDFLLSIKELQPVSHYGKGSSHV